MDQSEVEKIRSLVHVNVSKIVISNIYWRTDEHTVYIPLKNYGIGKLNIEHYIEMYFNIETIYYT